MNMYRPSALALLTCAAGLALAACSAGVSTVSTPSPATSNSPVSSSHAPASSSSPAGTVSLGGSIGAFPLPPGASVVENVTYQKSKELLLSGVTPGAAVSFYTSALPRAGYTITTNSLASTGTGTFGGIEFTGHGYKGTIGAESGSAAVASGSATAGVSLPSGNLVVISLTPQ